MLEALTIVVIILVLLLVVEKILKIMDLFMHMSSSVVSYKMRMKKRNRKANKNPIGFQTNKN